VKNLTVTVTDDEYARLLRLAEFRKKSPVDCVRDFIRSCQPGGSGWAPPCDPAWKSEETK